ncbi:MAG: hypothetical protein EOM80_01810 [Erysipelotrichia bacterium]|nr:hypothetical protein [Erysipelotrichia bacterium]
MRRLIPFVFLVSGFLTPLFSPGLMASSERVSYFHDQLGAIQDLELRRTLENSIAAGLIESDEDFKGAVSRAEAIANNGSQIYYSAYGSSRNVSEIRQKIAEVANSIVKLDRDALKVTKSENYRRGMLFNDYDGSIPHSYTETIKLCEKFNPKNGTNDASALSNDIDAFLDSIKNDPVILHALKSTDTSIEDLKKNWFGSGRGFEHVVAGEVDGSKVSGYHWWYKFYDDERNGCAQVKTAVAGIGNPRIYTGSFSWDPDGDGPMKSANKPKGGFANCNSVQSLLALGHIAIETARSYGSVPGALTFRANINGEEFNWQLYTMNGNIRSLYPMTNKGDIGEDAVSYKR